MNDKDQLLLSMRINDELLEYPYSDSDRRIISLILAELNRALGTSYSTYAELATLKIHGAGEIVAKYIDLLSSESAKMELLHHMVADKIKECGQILLKLYSNYQQKVCLLPSYPNKEEFYDDAFRRLRSKRIQNELISLVFDPVNAFALPLTLKMLASWKIPCLKEQLIMYLDIQSSPMNAELSGYKNYDFICRELRLSAIECLRFYPTEGVIMLLDRYSCSNDPDIRECARRSLARMQKDGTVKSEGEVFYE